ncbi:hypothetical protein [Alteraurantiacibacter buctensis]|uniref:Uncharacterized protein n=1 Tax=Alteraurantiacibacter buctensis TaxID=1503981 RepID=A0A844Z170_9SPHN|nr:hypothetical protein [Alteraurantiacibacter buctensis]MXO72900.1 hypothetical protein [Alteraurantiacibacter buctensis]
MTEAEQERAAIVAWLRGGAVDMIGLAAKLPDWSAATLAGLERNAAYCEQLANQIEAGAHRQAGE